MKKLSTEILVIGGGATGTGILRDLAMRGFKTILVEKRDLTHGTTGRFHGLLHSGSRYVVKDPQTAKECIQENRILRKIMPHCIEDTGGFFVTTPWDEPGYSDPFVRGCHTAGIPVEEISISKMLEQEPLLNPEISRCFRVPDASVDGFLAAHANVASAQEYGAQVLTYHEVIRLLTGDQGSKPTGRVSGARCHDLVKDEEILIHADLVINAAGAWAGKIGAMLGLEIDIRPGKGVMIAVGQRIVNTVINRCKMPADGDILVPAHTVAVMGTTDRPVQDPDRFAIEPWEVQLMLAEGEKLVPGFSRMRMIRAWAGVRPLYRETQSTRDNRDITRTFVLLDHQERDNLPGLLTITSGKWTTYRKMAEVTVDKVCEILGTRRKCRTHLEPLPTENRRSKTKKAGFPSPVAGHYLGRRLAQVEAAHSYGQLICECELVTRDKVERAIDAGQAKTLDDIRRDGRLGMGPCQGGFCTFRAAGILHQRARGQSPVTPLNAALRDFLQERWKGVLPVLWGQQARQERLNELIYLNVLNVDHLPGETESRLGSENYSQPDQALETGKKPPHYSAEVRTESPAHTQGKVDVVVIGGGLAGLAAAWQAASRGLKTKLITQGWGATHWGSGCIDILGYYPVHNDQPVDSPLSAIARLALEKPDHPYARINLATLNAILHEFQSFCEQSDYPLRGSLERNWLLPSAAGAIRPTCLAPATMTAGDLTSKEPMILVGIEGYHDFYPHWAAANLRAQGIEAQAISLDIPSLRSRNRLDTMTLARLFDDPAFRNEIAGLLKLKIGDAKRVGFPAVLGLRNALEVQRDLEYLLGCRVFEMPGLPPSVPGIRLHNLLVEATRKAGGMILNGAKVHGPETAGSAIESVWVEAAARVAVHPADHFILATGGILGGGIARSPNGYTKETVFDLPIKLPDSDAFQREFLHPSGHPVFSAGVRVNADLRPVDEKGQNLYENLYAVGGSLAGGDFVRERSLEGVALVTGYLAGGGLA